MAGSLADGLDLQGRALKLTVKGINTEEVVDTRVVEVTVKPREHQDFEPFIINPFVKESLNVGSYINNVQASQETYPHLAVLELVTYSYKDIEMILGQDVYHAIRPLEYFSADEKCLPVAIRLPIGWAFSGPLPRNLCLSSMCFKVNIEHHNELASQVMVRHWIIWGKQAGRPTIRSRRKGSRNLWKYHHTQWPEIRYWNVVGSRPHQQFLLLLCATIISRKAIGQEWRP